LSKDDGGDNDVTSIVLMAPMTWSSTRAHEFYEEQHGMDIRPVIANAEQMDGDQMLEGVPFLFCPETTAAARSYLSYHGEEPRLDTPSLVTAIPRPLLVVAAENDEIMADLPRLMENTGRSDMAMTVVADADHFFKGPFAIEAADAVAEFLDGLDT